uniref:Programmed cell death protein 4 n=1 Tax=Corethrella appendiculata TaxID=1370023 RepID=U5ER32_9DIPT
MDIEKNLNGEEINGIDGDVDGNDVGVPTNSTNGDVMKKPLAVPEEKSKKKGKKLARQSSKDGLLGVAGTPNFVAPHRKWKNSRRSRNGHGRGLPKKGGAGGKGVWGKLGSELWEEYEDQNDPNYDQEIYDNRNVELKEIIPEITLDDFTKKTVPIILEYYEHGDTHEVADSLDDFLTGNMRAMVTKVAVETALEHKQSQREMTSVLISDLYGRVVTSKDIMKGFDILLENLPDLILDTPDAPNLVGNFIARAIADDCIPPKYATHNDNMDDWNDHALTALNRAESLLTMHAGWSHLDNVWGVGGSLRPVQSITRQMSMLLQEYILSRDIVEAQRCIKQLEVPHFHHELIYEAVIMTLEALNESIEEAVCALLKSLDETCIVSPEMMQQAFRRVYDDMTDIVLDIPLAYSILDRFVQRCFREGFISEVLVKELPNRGRKRFVSEGDGGRIKPVNLAVRDF